MKIHTDPTAPAAALTSTVSPALGSQIRRKPKYAVALVEQNVAYNESHLAGEKSVRNVMKAILENLC